MEQSPYGLHSNGSDGDEQEQGIDQRSKDRGLLQSVREPRRGAAKRKRSATPGHKQAQHVGKIVTGVRQQGHRVGDEAEYGFDQNEGEVEGDADRERSSKAGRSMRMGVSGRMRMRVPVIGHEYALAE